MHRACRQLDKDKWVEAPIRKSKKTIPLCILGVFKALLSVLVQTTQTSITNQICLSLWALQFALEQQLGGPPLQERWVPAMYWEYGIICLQWYLWEQVRKAIYRWYLEGVYGSMEIGEERN